MQKARPGAAADVRDQPRGQRIHRRRIIAIDAEGRHAQRLGPRRRAGAGGHGFGAGEGGDAIVLADEQHGQPVQRGPVQPFQERSAIDRAIAEEAADDGG